jgi:hypothetical protein
MASLISPADAAVLTGELAKFLAFSMKDGLAPGVQGWWDDYCWPRRVVSSPYSARRGATV